MTVKLYSKGLAERTSISNSASPTAGKDLDVQICLNYSCDIVRYLFMVNSFHPLASLDSCLHPLLTLHHTYTFTQQCSVVIFPSGVVWGSATRADRWSMYEPQMEHIIFDINTINNTGQQGQNMWLLNKKYIIRLVTLQLHNTCSYKT